MRLSIYRYNPDADAKPYMQDYDIALEPTDRMLLDALVRLKATETTRLRSAAPAAKASAVPTR